MCHHWHRKSVARHTHSIAFAEECRDLRAETLQSKTLYGMQAPAQHRIPMFICSIQPQELILRPQCSHKAIMPCGLTEPLMRVPVHRDARYATPMADGLQGQTLLYCHQVMPLLRAQSSLIYLA